MQFSAQDRQRRNPNHAIADASPAQNILRFSAKGEAIRIINGIIFRLARIGRD
jgi:hypothetical protein